MRVCVCVSMRAYVCVYKCACVFVIEFVSIFVRICELMSVNFV